MTELAVVVATMLLLIYTARRFGAGGDLAQRCLFCGARGKTHSDDCPWKSRER